MRAALSFRLLHGQGQDTVGNQSPHTGDLLTITNVQYADGGSDLALENSDVGTASDQRVLPLVLW